MPDPFFARLRIVLERRRPLRTNLPGFTLAAVLLPLWSQDDGPTLLFIRRSVHVRHHKGEISFPGGRWDPGDADLARTAVREAQEEVGIPPHAVTLLGELDGAFSFSRFAISPFVAVLASPPTLRPNAEVAQLLPMPVRGFRLERFAAESRELDGNQITTFRYQVSGGEIWGATARILKGFLEIVRDDPQLCALLG
jgi:8-oxo-dGTP pyrophosphatase MutT (NUDIX family)